MPVVSDEDWIYGCSENNVPHSYLTKTPSLIPRPLQPLINKLFSLVCFG